MKQRQPAAMGCCLWQQAVCQLTRVSPVTRYKTHICSLERVHVFGATAACSVQDTVSAGSHYVHWLSCCLWLGFLPMQTPSRRKSKGVEEDVEEADTPRTGDPVCVESKGASMHGTAWHSTTSHGTAALHMAVGAVWSCML